MSDKVLEAISGLEKTVKDKQEAYDKAVLEHKAALETQKTEFQKLIDGVNQKHADEAKAINEELGKKGATLEQILGDIKDMKAKEGRHRGDAPTERKASVLIAEAFEEHFKDIQKVGKRNNVDIELKAAGTMTALASLTGNVVATYDLQPAVRGRRKINFRDLVPVINSATGVWKFYRENIPAPADGSLAQQTTHGNVKAQVDYDLTEVTVNAEYLAGFVRFAKQMAQDLPFLQNFIANELVEDYKRSESGLFLPALCAAATGDTSNAGTGVLVENIIDWIANLMANDYDPSAIITTARNWSTILRTKPQNYSIPGGVEIDAQGNIRIVGLPLLAQNNMASGKTLVGDFSKAAIIQAEGLSVNFYEQDSDNVQRNLITAKVEARVGLGIMRPDAFVFQ